MNDQTMTLIRTDFTNHSTIGELHYQNAFQCYTLELSSRKQSGVKVCIPEGKYEILMQWSARFQMNTPHLQNVPGRTFIEIHPGNKPEDTEGCILLGQTKNTDWVGSSRAAYQTLIPKIEAILKEAKLTIEITGGNTMNIGPEEPETPAPAPAPQSEPDATTTEPQPPTSPTV